MAAADRERSWGQTQLRLLLAGATYAFPPGSYFSTSEVAFGSHFYPFYSAGAITKTAVAPLERVKILFQLQVEEWTRAHSQFLRLILLLFVGNASGNESRWRSKVQWYSTGMHIAENISEPISTHHA